MKLRGIRSSLFTPIHILQPASLRILEPAHPLTSSLVIYKFHNDHHAVTSINKFEEGEQSSLRPTMLYTWLQVMANYDDCSIEVNVTQELVNPSNADDFSDSAPVAVFMGSLSGYYSYQEESVAPEG